MPTDSLVQILEGHALKAIVTDQSSEQGSAGKPSSAVRGVELVEAAPDGSVPGTSGGGGGGGGGAAVHVVSCGALVLATGGFAANRELLRVGDPRAGARPATLEPVSDQYPVSSVAAACGHAGTVTRRHTVLTVTRQCCCLSSIMVECAAAGMTSRRRLRPTRLS